MNALKRIDINVIVIPLLTLLTFIILFVCRTLDDNRLTNWQWIFANVDAVNIYFVLILGIILAYAVSRISLPERYSIIFLFLFSYITAAVFWKEPEVIVDASRYFTQAKHLDVYGIGYFIREWGRDINIWTDMPLIPFLYGLIFKLFGESRVYIQAFTTLLFSITVVLTYNIGKRLWDETVGFYGGLLLLGIPYLFSQIPLMLVDVPAMFFLTFAIYTFIKALKRGGSWIPLASFAIFLAFYSKYSAWLMLSVLGVIFVVYMIKNKRQKTKNTDTPPPRPLPQGEGGSLKIPSPSRGEDKGGGTGEEPTLLKEGITLVPLPSREGLGEGGRTILFRGALIVSIAALLIGIVFWYKFDVFSEQLRLLISYQKPGLGRWGESFISTFFFQIHPFITASAIYSAYVAIKKRDIKYAIISWLIILILLLQIKRARYIIMAFPMLTLMASYGLQEIRDKDIRKFIVSCIVIFSLTVGIFAYLPFLQKMSAVNLKHSGEFLDSIDIEEVEVFTLPAPASPVNPAVSVPILDLFTKRKIIYHYDKDFSPPPRDFEKSPLRFTWEYKNPEYYAVIPPHPNPTCTPKSLRLFGDPVPQGAREIELPSPLMGGGEGECEKMYFRSKKALVIIAGDTGQQFPDYIGQEIKKYRYCKVFKISEGVFQYQTIVRVYYD